MSGIAPKEIQILLDCIRSREELQSDEMQPLREWIDSQPKGQLELARALAQNNEIESALDSLEIPVPPDLANRLYQTIDNVDPADETALPSNEIFESTPIESSFFDPMTVNGDALPIMPQPASDESEVDSSYSAKRWYQHSKPQFLIGLVSGLAALVLLGASLMYLLGFFNGLDGLQVASYSVRWFEELEENVSDWHIVDTTDSLDDFPQEVERDFAFQTKEFKTEYGNTAVFDLDNNKGTRGFLFIYESKKWYSEGHLTKQPGFPDLEDMYCVGVAKSGDMVSVLTVKGTSSQYQGFVKDIDPKYVFNQLRNHQIAKRYSSEDDFSVALSSLLTSF